VKQIKMYLKICYVMIKFQINIFNLKISLKFSYSNFKHSRLYFFPINCILYCMSFEENGNNFP